MKLFLRRKVLKIGHTRIHKKKIDLSHSQIIQLIKTCIADSCKGLQTFQTLLSSWAYDSTFILLKKPKNQADPVLLLL